MNSELENLRRESNKKLQSTLDRLVSLTAKNDLYIKSISETFSVSTKIDLNSEKDFDDKIERMERGEPPEYEVTFVLKMGKFDRNRHKRKFFNLLFVY